MFRIKTKNRGESLVEVLVALGIIASVLVSSFALLNRGISANTSIKNKIIAINIAREGVEGVRNIRDTNWLKYSGNLRNKWLCLDEISGNTINSCSKNIEDKKYILDFSDEYQRFLLKEATSQGQNKLSLDGNPANFTEYKLYKHKNTKRYTHQPTFKDGEITIYNPKTIFYRQLILTPEKVPNCGSTNSCTKNTRLKVISRVQWKEEKMVGTIIMETYLYDFFNREKYN